MPPPTPPANPVTEILEALLVRSTQSRTTHPVTSNNLPPVIDLSAASDDDLTIVHESRNGLRAQPQTAPSTVEEDDDIIVVSEDIVTLPPTAAHTAHDLGNVFYPVAADSDPHPPEVEVIDIEEDSDHDPDVEAMGAMLMPSLMEQRASQQVDAVEEICSPDSAVGGGAHVHLDDDVVECVPPVIPPRLVSSCDACPMRLGGGQGESVGVRISRCKHVLCEQCAVKSVWDSGDGVKSVPMCVVNRCRAPLADGEIEDALSGSVLDRMVAEGLQKFDEWRKTGILENGGVEFPGFAPEFTAAVRKGGGLDGVERLLEDDVRTACEPLWMWNDEASGGKGMWMCAACGELEHRDRNRGGVGNTDSKVAEDVQEVDMLNEIAEVNFAGILGMPPSPTYPHCAYARALGIYENIEGLGKVWEDRSEASKNKKNQRSKGNGAATAAQTADSEASGRGVRRSSRKRYLSASTVRSQKRRKTSSKTGFAKGTGYAGTSGSEWKGTSDKLLEESQTLDEEATFWLIRIRCFLLRRGSTHLSTWPMFMRLLLRHCRLPSHLAKILINESIMDVLGRIPVFYAALRVVHAITELPSLRILVTEPSDGDNGRSIAELVESLSRQAAVLSTGAGPEGLSESTAFLVKQIRKCIRGINRHNLLQIARNRNTVPCPVDVDEEDGKPGSREGDPMGDGPPVPSKDGGRENTSAGSPISFEADKVAYIENMRAHQFEAISGLAQSSVFFREALKADKQAVAQGKRQRRIASEVASLCSSLPLSWSSTILLRVDEDRYDFLRACIFGPEDTPYDSGAFIFDIYLPPGYPYVPPKFQLLTTGSGRVRFNPNLYSNGKVCLSLLGTWSGPSWTSASTILQVLVSIQSLILVPDPYFNEPGFERAIGTEVGKISSLQYNQRVQVDCAQYAIRANIRNPMPDLRAGILAHFRLKRRYLTHKLRGWFGTLDKNGKGISNVGGGGHGVGSANGGAVVSADPMAHGIVGAGMMSGPGSGAATMTGYGPGRNFRAPQLSAMTLELIEMELKEIPN